MTLLILFISFAVMLIVGVPIAYSMGLAAVLALWIQGEVPLVLLPQQYFTSIDNFQLLAVPLFILMGDLMKSSGLSESIINVCRGLVGHMRAGLAQVNVLTNFFMGSISGSALADTAAIGSILIPSMIKDGYRRDFSAVITATASFLAPLVPPGIAAIIYGSLAGVSVGKLFLAGIIPAIIIMIALMIVNWFVAGWAGGRPTERMEPAELKSAVVRAWPALLLPVIFVVGLRAGVVTVTEAAGIGVLYALVYSAIASRQPIRAYYELVVRSGLISASAFVVIGGAGLFGWVMTREGVGQLIVQLFSIFSDSPTSIMLILIAILTVLGTFLEIIPAMILCIPIFQPIVKMMHFDPVHFGTVVIMTLLIGSLTPPVGLVAMLACKIANIPYNSAMRLLLLYTALLTFITVIVAMFPGLIMWVPAMMK